MSVPVTVQIPVVTTLNDTPTRRGKVVVDSFELACEFEELSDDDAPVVLVTPPDRERYRRDAEGRWLKEIGPCPADHRYYHWSLPTAMERPGEFSLNGLRRLVPLDRRRQVAKALERAILEPERLGERLRQPTVRARVEAQIEAHAGYGEQFKIIGSALYRVSAEPYLGLRSDGFVISNHSTKGWQAKAHCPYDLYSCVETDLLLKMSAALDHSGKHRRSIDRFEIGDPINFSASFLKQRMTLLVSWMSNLFRLRSQDLTKAQKVRLQSAVAEYIDGGLAGLQAAALRARGGVLDNQVLGVAEAIFELPLEKLFEGALLLDHVLAVVATLREEWEDRPVVIQAMY